MMNASPTHRFRRYLAIPALIGINALLAGCIGTDAATEAKIESQRQHQTVEQLYNNGVDALNAQKYKVAVKQFDGLQAAYPYSPWAVNAQLMQGYAQYLQHDFTGAVNTLNHFIELHPTNKDIAYIYYLRALCYYERIEDIQREQKDTEEALNALQDVVTRFPDSAYAHDARLKIDLCRDHLAGKEMAIGRWYEQQHLYTAAINRYQRVVDDFQTTNHVPEALQRLTEVYMRLGMPDEAKRVAAVLGNNYPGSRWYAAGYQQLYAAGAISADGKDVQLADGSTPKPPQKTGLLHSLFAWFY